MTRQAGLGDDAGLSTRYASIFDAHAGAGRFCTFTSALLQLYLTPTRARELHKIAQFRPWVNVVKMS